MNYIYYLIYKFTLLTPSKKEQPEHIANMILAFITCANIYIVITLLYKYFDFSFFEFFSKNLELIFILTYVITLIIGYLYFISKKKYILLIKKFDNENKSRKLSKTILALIYIISIFFLAFII